MKCPKCYSTMEPIETMRVCPDCGFYAFTKDHITRPVKSSYRPIKSLK